MSYLELIAANSMFANKTNTFIGSVRTLEHAHPGDGEILVFKPELDDRFTSEPFIVSHDGHRLPCTLVTSAREMYEHVQSFPQVRVVAVDEVQLLDHDIIGLAEYLLDRGVMMLASGLMHSFRGEPFPFQLPGAYDPNEPRSPFTMGDFRTYADKRIPLNSVCTYTSNTRPCGMPADRVQRFKPGSNPREPSHYTDPLILISDKQDYAARCRRHHEVPGRPRPFT